MPKRKRSEADDNASSPPPPIDGKLGLQITRLTNKFDYGVVALSRALKTARGFERQKLGRREKAAKSEKDEGTFARLEEEVRVLKALDVHVTAEKYLFKQLVKTKRIAESPAFSKFRARRRISVEGPKNVAEANVTARLFKSNPVKNVLPGIMDGIRSILRVDEAPKGKTDKEDAKGKNDKRETKSEQESKPAPSPKQDRQFAEDSESESAEHDEDQDPSMDDAESLDYAQFDSRLASHSGSDSDKESNAECDGSSTSHNEEDIFATLRKRINYNPADADDISDSVSRSTSPDFSGLRSGDDDDNDDNDNESDETPRPKTNLEKNTKKQSSKSSSKSAAAAPPPKDTTFLPSLMMGGYWSGSESEVDEAMHYDDDDDNNNRTGAAAPRRKNRMGQQARRALWEKKYGSRANHIQKQNQQQQQQQKRRKNNHNDSRDAGWDVRKGATAEESGAAARWGKRSRLVGNGGGGGGGDRDANKHITAAHAAHASKGRDNRKTDDDNKPLHPSWEAARRAKEKKAQASFQGKKIVFD